MTSAHRTTAFKGGLLSVGMRWTDRLIGLASTLILARVLVPADFGLVAMAMIVVGLIDVLLDLGVGAALIQNSTADKADFDTAWTLRLCQTTLAAIIVAVGAPFVAAYYGDPRVVDVMRVIALAVLVSGLENIGIVRFQKDMEFGRDFRFFFTKRVIGTLVTIGLALTLRSYWALVFGSLAGRLIGVALSYGMHPFRPQWSFSRLGAIWSFSQWNLVLSIASYLSLRLDQFVVGRRADASVLGAYAVSDEIASMPTTEILAPLGRVMFPAFVNVRDDPAELRRIVLLAFGVQAFIGVPAGVGVALVAAEFVPILLGDQWTSAVPFVQVLGLVGVATALSHSGQYALLALGRVRALAMLSVARFFAFLLLLMMVFPEAEARAVAEVRLAVSLGALLGMLAMVVSAVPQLRAQAMLESAWRPLAGAAVMVPCVLLVPALLPPQALAVLLAIKVVVGVLAYAMTTAALWQLAGSPSGAESYLLEKVRLMPILRSRASN